MILRTPIMAQSELKDYVDVGSNIDVRYVEPYILTAQNTYIQPLLCRDLYVELLTAIDSGYPLSDALTALLPYVKSALAYYAFHDFLLNQGVRVTASGVSVKTSEWAQPAEDKAVYQRANFARAQGDTWAAALVDFLEANKADYPAYNCRECESGKMTFGNFDIF
jgi:hypothetical protein